MRSGSSGHLQGGSKVGGQAPTQLLQDNTLVMAYFSELHRACVVSYLMHMEQVCVVSLCSLCNSAGSYTLLGAHVKIHMLNGGSVLHD